MIIRRYRSLAVLLLAWSFLLLPDASTGNGTAPAGGGAPGAGDPELDAVLAQIESFAANGTYPGETRQTWWKARMDPFINAYAQDTGLSQNVVTWILFGDTEGGGALQTVNTALEQFGLACTAYDVVKNLAEGRQDLAFYTTAKAVMSDLVGRLGRGGKLCSASIGIIDYSLTRFGETAIAVSNQAWWDAYLDFQTRGERTDDFWIALFLKDGFAAVAGETDRFWSETEHLRGDAFFRTNNPNCVADYRARFVRHYLLPRLQGWLQAEKDIRRREAADRCRELREALARATFRVMGAVVNASTHSSVRRLHWKVRLVRPDGRELARETVSDSDHFELVGDLKDIPDGQFRVVVELADEATDSPAPAAEVMGMIGLPEANQSAPLELKRTGFNVRVRLSDIVVNAYVKRPEPPAPRDLWTVPAPLPDPLPDYAARLEAGWGEYQAGRVSLDRFRNAAGAELGGVDAAAEACQRRLSAIGQALEHNRRRQLFPLLRPDTMEEGTVPPETAARIEAESKPKIAAAHAAEKAFEKNWSDLKRLWEDRLTQSQASHQRRLAEAEQALQAARAEAQPVLAEFDRARTEAREQLQAWESAREAVVDDARSGRPDVPADNLGGIEALANGGAARFQAVAQNLQATAGRLREILATIEERQRVVSHLLAEGYGVPLDSPAQLFTRIDGETVRCEQAAEEAAAVDRLIREAQVPDKLERGADSFRRFAARKRAQMAETAGLVQQLEQAVAQCPDEAAVAACAGRYAALTPGVDAGAMAYRRAMAAGTAPALPREICDAQGDDTAFWRRQAAGLAAFARDEAALVGDLLPAPLTRETPLGRANRAAEALASRQSDLTTEQSAKVDELLNRVWKLAAARASSPLGAIGRHWPAVQVLAGSGATAAERWAALAAADQQLQARAAEALAAAARLPRCIEATPAAEVRAAQAQAVRLLQPLSLQGSSGLFDSTETLERIGQARAAVAATGLWTALRRLEQRPSAPAEITIQGRPVPLDGRCVRIPQQACGGRLEISVPASGYLRTEYGWAGGGFWPVDRTTRRLDDFVFSPAPAPIVLRLTIRVSLPDGSATSQLADEPPLTIALVP